MNLPEELKFQPMSQPHSATLYNYKTQPVSYLAGNLVRFQVPDAGIMNSGSAYVEFVVPPQFEGASFPLAVGCHSAIKRARLITQSGRIICDQRDYNKKQVFEKPFRTSEYNRFVAPYMDGSFLSYVYNHTGNLDYASTPAAIQNKLRVAGEPIFYTANNTGSDVNDSLTWSKPQVLQLYKGATGTFLQQFRVSLTELFPLLYSHQLPVQIMERIYIEIEFEKDLVSGDVLVPLVDNGTKYVSPDARAYVNGPGISNQGLFLVTDHLVFDNPEVMARIEDHSEKNGGIAFPFEDYAVQLFSITSAEFGGTDQEKEVNRQLGSNNYKLCNIKVTEQAGDLSGVGIPTIFGKYHSSTPEYSSKQINYSINDVNLYPNNDAKLPVQYDRASNVYDYINPAIPRPVYGCDIKLALEPLIDTQFFNGTPMATGNVDALNIQGVYLKDQMGQEMKNGNSAIRAFVKYVTDVENGALSTGCNQQYFIGYKRELAVSRTGQVMVNQYS